MRVFTVNSVCGYGSTGKITIDLYDVLKENGHECLIAYGRGKAPEGYNTYRIGTDKEVYFNVLMTRLFDRHGYGSKKATLKLTKKIKEFNPDIIHLHNLHGYYINLKILFDFLSEYNKPVVWTLHDCWTFTGHCAHFDYIKCNQWQSGCIKCSGTRLYPVNMLFKRSQKNYLDKKILFNSIKDLTIVTPCLWISELLKLSILKNNKTVMIRTGINLNVFKPVESDIRKKLNLENKFIILGVASIWTETKGLNYFIKLSETLNDEFKIIVIGINKKQQKYLPENIIGIERTNNQKELAEYYSSANVFVNPTLEDTFPTTNLEALACGTPVITFNTGGSPESIDEKCGIVVEKGNFEELKKAILKIREHPFDRDYCMKKGLKYGKADKYNEYLRLYEGLLK